METRAAWVINLRRRASVALRLVCFPFAGAGTTPFRPWVHAFPATVEVSAMCLPGREHRSAEPFATDLKAAAEQAASELAQLPPAPIALFGHSLGAILAFEVARALRRRGVDRVVHLWVSARPAPHLPTLRSDELHLLTDERLVATLREMGGTPAALFDDPEWVAFMLPIARADLVLHAGYRLDPEPPLACPITAFGGEDDPWVSAEQLAAWREHTTGGFAQQRFPGDHFYLSTAAPAVTAAIARALPST